MSYERLSAQDAMFLHVEDEHQPMHVGSLALFEGAPFFDESGRFRIDEARAVIAGRMHLVPRFRKRLMFVPLDQGRPVWVDDDNFDLAYHVRLTALPRPGSEEQLKALVGRLQGQRLDRRRPLWELWFVEGVAGDRVAIVQKTHHCLVDGISGVDVATVLLDLEPTPPPVEAQPWEPEPAPAPAQLLVESLVERATDPVEAARSLRAALRGPQQLVDRVAAVGRAVTAAGSSAPKAPWNERISPHRRFEVARVPFAQVKSIKDRAADLAVEGERITVNDVVVAACAGALRGFLQSREEPVDDLVLRAMVPVSVRSEAERGALGNKVSMMTADLPVGEPSPTERLRAVHASIRSARESGQAVGAQTIISLLDYAPPTLVSMASRLTVRSRAVNLTITNVPGPQFPLYCAGARMLEAFPYVPIVDGQGLTIGIVSYDGQLAFGLTGDRDLLPDLAVLAEAVEKSFAELAEAVAT
jgi:diacylglycerol O-acyltransferase / wax synthase